MGLLCDPETVEGTLTRLVQDGAEYSIKLTSASLFSRNDLTGIDHHDRLSQGENPRLRKAMKAIDILLKNLCRHLPPRDVRDIMGYALNSTPNSALTVVQCLCFRQNADGTSRDDLRAYLLSVAEDVDLSEPEKPSPTRRSVSPASVLELTRVLMEQDCLTPGFMQKVVRRHASNPDMYFSQQERVVIAQACKTVGLSEDAVSVVAPIRKANPQVLNTVAAVAGGVDQSSQRILQQGLTYTSSSQIAWVFKVHCGERRDCNRAVASCVEEHLTSFGASSFTPQELKGMLDIAQRQKLPIQQLLRKFLKR